mmetsp:Transcript_5409/g.13357  ORF Transcript_5409/g.13357 Transcript_5409/m.13357 type:complete len:90 (-) Transcript_5409:375-644(-)
MQPSSGSSVRQQQFKSVVFLVDSIPTCPNANHFDDCMVDGNFLDRIYNFGMQMGRILHGPYFYITDSSGKWMACSAVFLVTLQHSYAFW